MSASLEGSPIPGRTFIIPMSFPGNRTVYNILITGPPGADKSMLAKALPGIFPDLSPDEALEVTRIQSVVGVLTPGAGLVRQRPFRAPHHTVTAAALIGGGGSLRPGEITLAHRGVLFLDELPESPLRNCRSRSGSPRRS